MTKRTFAMLGPDGTHVGRYTGKVASQAARKAFTRQRGNKTSMTFTMVEIERGFKHQPLHFRGDRVPLDPPRTIPRVDKNGNTKEHSINFQHRVKRITKVPAGKRKRAAKAKTTDTAEDDDDAAAEE
jgi:hypothetical protein